MKFLFLLTILQWPSERPVAVAANAANGADLMWPNNTIPYEFPKKQSFRFGEAERTRITEAMEIIMHLTGHCVKFVERNSETDYIRIQRGKKASAETGHTGGRETVSLTRECIEHYGCIQHELMHVMGFYHEQSRLDRDDYVTINWDNIAKEDKGQFAKFAGQTYDLPYDYESVMHYAFNAFAVDDSLPTILPTTPVKMGQKEDLSPLDVARIHRRFRCRVPSGRNFIKSQLPDTPTDQSKKSSARNDTPDGAMLEPFPTFSGEPMSREQCAYQFNTNCIGPGYTLANCVRTQALQINCKKQSPSGQLQDMALGMSKGPLRAITLSLFDGGQINFNNFAAIRKQIIVFNVYNCVSNRTTAKLPQLQYHNLLSFNLWNCYGMWIQRSDFAQSINLREIILQNTTILFLERETFTDLPALKLLSLDSGFRPMKIFSEQVRDYLTRHYPCGGNSTAMVRAPCLVRKCKYPQTYGTVRTSNVLA